MSKRTVNKQKVVEIINGTKGRFFTVTFLTKAGKERTINGNYKLPKNPNPLGYLNIYSAKDKGYRNVNTQTIKSVTVNNTTYVVR